MDNPKIYVAFRFNVNMQKSKNVEETNKNVRIINHIIRSLNVLNAKGTKVLGTWAIENRNTLGEVLKNQYPEIIDQLLKRKSFGDEIEAVGYNAPLFTALDNEECDFVLKNTVKNTLGCGLTDVFGGFAPIIRTDGEMLSPSMISHLRSVGFTAVSLNYSGVKPNALANYIKVLDIKERFNPLYYKNPATEEKIALILSVNPGEINSRLSLNAYVKRLRAKQLYEETGDLLLLIDADSSDVFWYGYADDKLYSPKKSAKFTRGGIYKMVNSLLKKDYVEFTTPYEYLKTHQPEKELVLPFDLADGGFDGYKPYAESPHKSELFTDVVRSRYFEYLLSDDKKDANAVENRVLKLANSAFTAESSNIESANLNEEIKSTLCEDLGNRIDYTVDNPYVDMNDGASGILRVEKADGKPKKYVVGGKVLTSFKSPYENCDYVVIKDSKENLSLESLDAEEETAIKTNFKSLESDSLKITQIPGGSLKVFYKGEEFIKRCLRPSVYYGGKLYRGETYKTETYNIGEAHVMKINGRLNLINAEKTEYEYIVTLVNGLPYLYFDGTVTIPDTLSKRGDSANGVDKRFTEVMPFEFFPAFNASDDAPFKITKHNYYGDQIKFDVNFGELNHNRKIDSFNNAITNGYIAVSNGEKGVLIAQSLKAAVNPAFCPMKINYRTGEYFLRLNPFGTYFGKENANPLSPNTLFSLHAKKIVGKTTSTAPNFNGKTLKTSMMIAFFYGGSPSEELVRSAFFAAYPPKRK